MWARAPICGRSGFELTGASSVVLKFLNTTYLWDKVRVQGGAYGGSSRFDLTSGNFSFLSYRDPNLLKTLDAYDGAAKALNAGIGENDLTRSIIGVIGDVDGYEFPDAKGYSSMWRQLTGTTDAIRQQRRDEILGDLGRRFPAHGGGGGRGGAAWPCGGAGRRGGDHGGQ